MASVNLSSSTYPIVRTHSTHEESPEVAQYHEEYFVPLVRGIAALLAILQDMIIKGASGYKFEQHEDMFRIPFIGQQDV